MLVGKDRIAPGRPVPMDALDMVHVMVGVTAYATLAGMVLIVQAFPAPMLAVAMDNATTEHVAAPMATEEMIVLSRDVRTSAHTMVCANTMELAFAEMVGNLMTAR